MARQIPLVDYLVLGDQPHLVANECTNCGTRYFDRRNACAGCFGTDFGKVGVDINGKVRAITTSTLDNLEEASLNRSRPST